MKTQLLRLVQSFRHVTVNHVRMHFILKLKLSENECHRAEKKCANERLARFAADPLTFSGLLYTAGH